MKIKMGNAILILCVLILLISCTETPEKQIAKRWDIISAKVPDMPAFKKAITDPNEENGDALAMKRFFLSDKFILYSDSSFELFLMHRFIHGKWVYQTNTHKLILNDLANIVPSVELTVNEIKPYIFKLNVDSTAIRNIIPESARSKTGYGYFLNAEDLVQFILVQDHDTYWNDAKDPYSIVSNDWRIKPMHSETDPQIFERVIKHLQFWRLLFQDAMDNDKNYVAYEWFNSPLVVATNGVALRKYEHVKEEWGANFFDSTEAEKGYVYLQKCFYKSIKLTTSDNPFQNKINMIDQLIENLNRNKM